MYRSRPCRSRVLRRVPGGEPLERDSHSQGPVTLRRSPVASPRRGPATRHQARLLHAFGEHAPGCPDSPGTSREAAPAPPTSAGSEECLEELCWSQKVDTLIQDFLADLMRRPITVVDGCQRPLGTADVASSEDG
jgi:hypothetical protein